MARGLSVMAHDEAVGCTVLFGGVSGSDADLGDTWIFADGEWRELTLSVSPPARRGASMAYDANEGHLVLFGGFSAGSLCNDTWKFQDRRWTGLNRERSPSPRAFAAMAYDAQDDAVVLFGGGDGGSLVNGDTWTFRRGQWSQLAPPASPPARAGASMAWDSLDGYLVMYGGTRNYTWEGAALSDTWKFSDGRWTLLSPSLTPPDCPGTRYTYSLVNDPALQGLLMFGGWSPRGGNASTSWTFSAGRWAELPSDPSPSARQASAADYDPSAGGVLLFGGLAAGGPPVRQLAIQGAAALVTGPECISRPILAAGLAGFRYCVCTLVLAAVRRVRSAAVRLSGHRDLGQNSGAR
jgi:hypothetical protein